MKKFLQAVLGFFLLLQLSCSEKVADSPVVDQPPKTFLWLYSDSTLGTGISRQHLHWWGEDPDGAVRGYLFAFGIYPGRVTGIPRPDTLRYTWVTANDTVIRFPLFTAFENFTVFVRAVDNRFAGLPNQSVVRFSPNPYWDKNANGTFDGSDEQLAALSSAADPTGAVQTFPVRNSPPSIGFFSSLTDPTGLPRQPETTYTVATFGIKGTDPDGDNTLSSYRVALNDTVNPANWLTVALRDTVLTLLVPRARSDSALRVGAQIVTADVYSGTFLGRRLIGSLPGLRLNALNRFFAQSRDVAGEFSRAISLPSATGRWFVKTPSARLLLVNDYIITQFVNPLPVYLRTLGGVPDTTVTKADFLDIARGLDNQAKSNGATGVMVPPFVDPALINTMLLYDYVIWYTDIYPSLAVSQLAIFPYLQNGGKVIFSTSFRNSLDRVGLLALKDTAPLDSIDTENLLSAPDSSRGSSAIPARYRVIPDASDPSYPQLAFDTTNFFHTIFMRPLYKRSDAQYIYHLQRDTANIPAKYVGSPNIGVVDGQRRIIFIGVPLHLLDNRTNGNPQGVTAFFTRAFTQQFNSLQRVDRRRF